MSLEHLEAFIGLARDQHASDLHLEPGLPAAVRVRGSLRTIGERVSSGVLHSIARALLSDDVWHVLQERRSHDMSKTVRGVRCRINIMHSARGIGLAVRLLSPFQASLKRLNLHPDLARLVTNTHGLVIVSGATGSGKSSTLAALLHEVNANETRHIITIESPIEYAMVPRKSFIRQREVGRDTPSFAQGLMDALREDPDVLMVGEMRDPETMRLTLSASETGHLVLTTLHSSNTIEALQRLVSAFAPEVQASVCAQLADTLVAVVSQRLGFRADLGVAVPECEILLNSTPVRSIIRQGAGAFNKLQTALETGAQDGNWSYARYRDWLDRRTDLYVPRAEDNEAPPDEFDIEPQHAAMLRPAPRRHAAHAAPTTPKPDRPSDNATADPPGVLIIDEDAPDLATLVAEMERKR